MRADGEPREPDPTETEVALAAGEMPAETPAHDAATPDLFGELPAGPRAAAPRAAHAGEDAQAAEAAVPDARQGSFFDGLEAEPAPAPVVHEAAIDVTEVAAAVQEAVDGLSAEVEAQEVPATPPAADDAAAASAAPKPAAAKRAPRRKPAPAPEAATAPVAAPVDQVPPAATSAVVPPQQPAPAPVEAPAPAADLDAQLRPLTERLRALQLETVELRRAADREMRRVNRLLLALAVVVLIGIVALGLQTVALSSVHRDADDLQRRVDHLTATQETQQANLSAAQQRADELGAQVQRLTNRVAVASRAPAAQPSSAPASRRERERERRAH